MNENLVEVELGNTFENITEAAEALANIVDADSTSITMAVHNVQLKHLNDSWKFELVVNKDENGNNFLIARKRFGSVEVTAFLEK